MSYPKHVRATYINSKDFTNIDLAPLSPTKSSTSTQYAKFRNDRVLSVQDRRSRGQAVQPLGQRTKRSIFGLRRALLVVRTLQLLGAAGLLACLCLLGNIPDIQSYIVRAPVSVDSRAERRGYRHGFLLIMNCRHAWMLRLLLMGSMILHDPRNIAHLLRHRHITSSRS